MKNNQASTISNRNNMKYAPELRSENKSDIDKSANQKLRMPYTIHSFNILNNCFHIVIVAIGVVWLTQVRAKYQSNSLPETGVKLPFVVFDYFITIIPGLAIN